MAEPGGTVDDQQDSFNYGHRKLFHSTRDSAFVLRMTFACSVAAILTIFDVRFSIVLDEESVVAAFRKLTDKSLRRLLADRSRGMGFPRERPLLEVRAGLGVVAVCF